MLGVYDLEPTQRTKRNIALTEPQLFVTRYRCRNLQAVNIIWDR